MGSQYELVETLNVVAKELGWLPILAETHENIVVLTFEREQHTADGTVAAVLVQAQASPPASAPGLADS
jgi:hypothetical protein